MDITNYKTLPTIKIPGMVRELTAAECEAKAQETIADLEGCINPRMRRYLKRELRGWQRLAAERACGYCDESHNGNCPYYTEV